MNPDVKKIGTYCGAGRGITTDGDIAQGVRPESTHGVVGTHGQWVAPHRPARWHGTARKGNDLPQQQHFYASCFPRSSYSGYNGIMLIGGAPPGSEMAARLWQIVDYLRSSEENGDFPLSVQAETNTNWSESDPVFWKNLTTGFTQIWYLGIGFYDALPADVATYLKKFLYCGGSVLLMGEHMGHFNTDRNRMESICQFVSEVAHPDTSPCPSKDPTKYLFGSTFVSPGQDIVPFRLWGYAEPFGLTLFQPSWNTLWDLPTDDGYGRNIFASSAVCSEPANPTRTSILDVLLNSYISHGSYTFGRLIVTGDSNFFAHSFPTETHRRQTISIAYRLDYWAGTVRSRTWL